MTEKEAIEAIRIEGLTIQGNGLRVGEFLEGLNVATKALTTIEMIKDRHKEIREEIGTDKIANSMKEIDLSELKLPTIAIFNHPLDYPDKAVARIFDIDKPMDTVIVKYTLEELQRDIKENTNMVFMTREVEDVESLVGVWI